MFNVTIIRELELATLVVILSLVKKKLSPNYMFTLKYCQQLTDAFA